MQDAAIDKVKGGQVMTSESKILTVSYGTFSCTLEGFDDPFNTMKAIAEYFRDLTAEDRYFGAVPPQPDAAMMHRVADREVSRLVGSKARDAGLVIRPGDLAASEGRVTGRPRTARAPVEEPNPPIAEPALQESMPTGVVAKLARIRDAVSQPLEEVRPEDVLNAFREDAEDLAPTIDNPASEAEATVEVAVGTGDAASRIDALLRDPEAELAAGAADSNIFADLSAREPIEEVAPSASEAESAIEVETEVGAPFIAVDDLVPEDHDLGAQAEEMLAQELPADQILADAGLADETALDELSADAGETGPEAGASTYADDALDALTAAAETLAAEEAVVESSAETEPEDFLVEAEALQVEVVEAAAEDMPLAAEDAAIEAEADADADAEAAETDAPLPTTRSGAKTRRVNSRVVRIHAEDDEGQGRPSKGATRMVPSGEADEVARLMRQADDVMADEENRRRIESLAHLKAAVAVTEADRAAGEEMKPTGPSDADVYRDDLAQVVLPDPEPGPVEVKPRRKTMSVRPQEPRPGTIRPGMVSPPPLVLISEQRIDRIAPSPEPTPTFAPAARVPSPLPAEPSQPGIDSQQTTALRTGRLTGAIGLGAAAPTPAAESARVVMNRATPVADMDDEDGLDEQLSAGVEAGLANFAESVGVKSMAEMLEAAAAYATCVERRDQFTRPQLMRRLMASAGGKPVSREDGLRSFGTLLRTGRIEKVGRGHYVLAEQSPYLAEARRFN